MVMFTTILPGNPTSPPSPTSIRSHQIHVIIALHLPHKQSGQIDALKDVLKVARETIAEIEEERLSLLINDLRKRHTRAHPADDFQSFLLSQSSQPSSSSSDCTQTTTQYFDLDYHDKWRHRLRKRLRKKAPVHLHILGDWNIDFNQESSDNVAPSAMSSMVNAFAASLGLVL
jgi:hypothetical protein